MSFSKTRRRGSCKFSFSKNSLEQINSKLNSKPCDYRYELIRKRWQGLTFLTRPGFIVTCFRCWRNNLPLLFRCTLTLLKKKVITKQISCWKHLTTEIRSKKRKELTKKKTSTCNILTMLVQCSNYWATEFGKCKYNGGVRRDLHNKLVCQIPLRNHPKDTTDLMFWCTS